MNCVDTCLLEERVVLTEKQVAFYRSQPNISSNEQERGHD